MKVLNALIYSIAIILATYLLGDAYLNRANPDGTIATTGLGSSDFVSDLIVWEADFVRVNPNLQLAFNDLARDKNIVRQYLLEKGINEDRIVFEAVSTNEQRENLYQNGDFTGTVFKGYELRQTVKIESQNVKEVELVSREITELLNRDVQLQSSPPRYYYTKLADLKIEMISQATSDARIRAQKIAENSGGELGELKNASMGVFQITGQNSSEDYSWGGSFNTSDKNKTASITMRLEYEIE
ncbi:SIMPL domain-containing protein [Flavimarina sp. Hel_I_48]|uniref:SIMPL domain-containing protein n=1 Tax=Flavimarina sp. Hel_I_48 TaxID=1392488 RepID=UPI0004DFB11F|nr:SIMPL domain-containing protein [Flavimarina sp. Hel_I_48]